MLSDCLEKQKRKWTVIILIFDEIGGNSASEDIFGDDGLKRFDLGLGLKAGVEFSKKYQVAISYDFGLVEVIKEVGMKNRNLMISLGYMF